MCVCVCVYEKSKVCESHTPDESLIFQPNQTNKAWLIFPATLAALLFLMEAVFYPAGGGCAAVACVSPARALSCKKWPALRGAVEEENNLW